MGQYYVPVILDEDGNIEKRMNCYEFDHGAKLMECAYLDSEYVAAFETLLCGDLPRRVVWAGDYADPERYKNGKIRKVTIDGEKYDATLYTLADAIEPYRPDVPGLGMKANYQWQKDGKRLDKPIITYVRDPDIKANAWPSVLPRIESHPYLVNWDKKVFVDKRNVPAVPYYWTSEPKTLHPLPILTAEGNGRGGGDFNTGGYDDRTPPRGNFDLIGSWARDHIAVAGSVPADFTEIDFDLIEMGSEVTAADKKANKAMHR